MYCNLFHSSQTITFCMNLDRLPHRHRCTNSIQNLRVIESCAEEISANSHAPELFNPLNVEEECFFLYSSLDILSSFSLLSQPLFWHYTVYLTFWCLLLDSRHIYSHLFLPYLSTNYGSAAIISGPFCLSVSRLSCPGFLHISHTLTYIRWTIK